MTSLKILLAVPVAVVAIGFPRIFHASAKTPAAPAPGITRPLAGDVDPALLDMQRRAAATPVRSRYSSGEAPQLQVDDAAGEPGDVIVLVPVTNCKEVRYFALDKGLSVIPRQYLNTQTDFLCWAINPGVYRVAAYAALNDVLTDPVIATITVANHGPQPPPGPGPGPQPPPNPPPGPQPPPPPPQTAALKIVSLDNAAARNPATAGFIANTAYWAAVKAAGHSFWLIDSNNTTQSAYYRAQVDAAGGLPVVVIMDQGNKILGTVPYPKDATGRPNPSTDWLNSVIAKFGGKAVTR